ncbi:hypothetical protein M5K25_025810 [Dendrobium thyrsiflorum]|uniref:Uncharacterized protein n=1 Tax=Dendrobium thyrsiflorum TaxID=117978 RepID=A0ABD0UAA1_DENTH
MEESQNEILQLLRETRQPMLAPREEILLPRDPPGLEDVQPEHLHIEIPLPPPRMHPQSHQNGELADTESSTHPSHSQGDSISTSSTQVNVIEQGSDIQPRIDPTSLVDSLDLFHTDFCQTSATLNFRQSPDFCLVARLSPVVGLSSDIYPTLNFLRSSDFYPSPDFCDAGLSSVTRLLPVVGLSTGIYPTLNFLRSSDFCLPPDFCDAGLTPSFDFCPSSDLRRTSTRRLTSIRRRTSTRHRIYDRRRIFVGHIPDSELPSAVGLTPVTGLLPVDGLSSDIGLTPIAGLLPVDRLSSDFYLTWDLRQSPDFCPYTDVCRTPI